ncbi:MAG TPA: 3-carboxy-cis,cis-muconate cycloisomerase [Candidatus Binatus sp.]|uniref:3-carboxy-cis,cis-muconate cycloisomerase n=1 Tax=Candidatus Binatus sp. TaxID=2811406 RepID=UPI002B45A782|nr:3-carboxy-cis,cis-muconate cycloisomerase [Candidatus Binatus sp.]HKN11561.1 3-carboxy-cis,cis-muconate cycloisomerase [Candidatus Binatus sp.]
MSINPADSQIFGTLYGTDEIRALFSDQAHLQFMLDVEAALARAESKLGLVPAPAADAIGRAARVENLRLDYIAESTRRVGYPVVALVKELGRIAGDEAARYVHLGATTQDILDTALVLQLRRAFAIVRRDLVALARVLADRAARFRDTPIAGRTHLQHAVPTTFGLKCAGWASPLVTHVERLDQATPRILVVQLGGAAGTLAALGANGPAVVEALARELALGVPDLPCHAQRDPFAETAALLGLICGSLSKFALDVSLMMQTEVGEVSEPHDDGRGGSSTMPQKRNPIASEYILAATRAVHALVQVMLGSMTADHERATGPLQSESLALPQCVALTAGALIHARSIAEGMTVDTERMRRNLDLTGGLIMAEAVATALVAPLGRAAAEAAVARACDRSIAEGVPLAAILRIEPELRPHLTDAEIDRLTNPSLYLGSAGAFVDQLVARVAALR